MHCSVLWIASQRYLNKYGKLFGTWRIPFFRKQRRIVNNPHWIIFFKKL
jgi:hypothetical protein